MFSRYIAVRKNQWKLEWQTIKELLHIGVPSSMQVGLESGAFAVSGIIIGTLGAVQLGITSNSDQLCIGCLYGFLGAGTGRFYKSK